jgi:hypothetical protein
MQKKKFSDELFGFKRCIFIFGDTKRSYLILFNKENGIDVTIKE